MQALVREDTSLHFVGFTVLVSTLLSPKELLHTRMMVLSPNVILDEQRKFMNNAS
jgi:hypothetical protein